jgi:acetyl esterase/lipase
MAGSMTATIQQRRILTARAILLLALAAPMRAQSSAPAWTDPASWRSIPKPTPFKDLVYRNASGKDLHLDVYQNAAAPVPAPVLVYFHGGAWIRGEKPASYGGFRAWLAAGFSVVTVEYRLTGDATAPAAVQDVRCSLAWVKANAHTYNFDPSRVVPYGTSAGGHLALMAGMLPPGNDIDPPDCRDQPRVVAILDFYGPYHLDPALPGAFTSPSTAKWIGPAADVTAMEHKMSPATYVRKGQPPVFIAHGDADPTVPYLASQTLKQDLDKAGVPNEFITVPGGHHGQWTPEENIRVQLASLKFLEQQGVIP